MNAQHYCLNIIDNSDLEYMQKTTQPVEKHIAQITNTSYAEAMEHIFGSDSSPLLEYNSEVSLAPGTSISIAALTAE